MWGLLFLWSLWLFCYIVVVIEEDVCIRDYMCLGLCRVGIVGCSVVMSVNEGGVVW
jgi:hypothetical protein